MYNELEHDLIELELPNIVYRVRKGETLRVITHPFLQPLMTKLAKARPKWKLVGTRFVLRDDGSPVWATSFTVVEGYTALGEVRKDFNHSISADCFAIDNPRMSARRQRGYATMTKDVNKAFKIITKDFHGKTTEELVADARGDAYNYVSKACRDHNSAYHGYLGNMRGSLLAFACQQWDAYRDFAKDNGVTENTLDNFHEAKDLSDAADDMQQSWNNRSGMLVVLRGDDYIVTTGDDIRIMTNSDLTPHMKQCIGMLKLADKGTFIPTRGIKVNDTTMYVMEDRSSDGRT